MYIFHSWSAFTGTHEPNKLTRRQLSAFITHLVEHCTDIEEVMDSNPAKATLNFSGVYKMTIGSLEKIYFIKQTI